MSSHWVHVRGPWQAVIDRRAVGPARHYAAIVGQALRYSLPGARPRAAWAWSLLGRTGVPEGPIAAALRRLPAQPRPDLDRLLAETAARWPELAVHSQRLPPKPPELAGLFLERRAARIIFVFGDEHLLLVLKQATGPADALERETAALQLAGPAGAGPLPLGRVSGAHAQEALPGAPLRVVALTPARCRELEWSPALAAIARGFATLAETTATSDRPALAGLAFVDALLERGPLHGRLRARLAAAARDVRGLSSSVLCHLDSSPQNLLMNGDRFTGAVDWELAEPRGLPGVDVLISAISFLEHGLGLVRFNDEIAVAGFRAAREGGYWEAARAEMAQAVAAAGLPEHYTEVIEVVFWGARAGRLMMAPGCSAASIPALKGLEAVG